MNRFIITAAVFTIAFVATTGTAHAQPQGKKLGVVASSGKSLTLSNSNTTLRLNNSLQLNNKLSLNKNLYHQNCYRPQTYCGWTSCCYYPQYGCYCHYCPQDCLWYYWSQTLCYYVPITYITVYQPTTIGVVALQQGAVVTQTAPGIALPAGATALQAGGATGLPPGGAGVQQMGFAKN